MKNYLILSCTVIMLKLTSFQEKLKKKKKELKSVNFKYVPYAIKHYVLYHLGFYLLNLRKFSVIFINQNTLLLLISTHACKDPC